MLGLGQALRPAVASRVAAAAQAQQQRADASSVGGWRERWIAATDDLRSNVTFDESANQLRKLIKTRLLTFTDLRDNPERFFEAHRILARHAVAHGPGFWIRFTVQYNLFAGTVLAVGGDEQIASLDAMQDAGQLGCFALTEQLAGVQSGLVVETTADWDDSAGEFVINTPHVGARKNWISQGATADKAVVVASLTVGEKKLGPHAFLADFRSGPSREVLPGITLADMGEKTTGNDLDNAWLHFDGVRLPKTALLNRYCDVVDGAYVLPPAAAGIRPFDMIGQRLYTGRVAVAQAALEFSKSLFAVTRQYSDKKHIWAPSARPPLSSIPQLSSLYDEAEATLADLERLVAACEAELCAGLRESTPPPADLVLAIATCKVRAVERSIALTFRLKQEVGSYALMANGGFKHLDFLQCCKFAEGDSRILMQKMARDRLKQHADGKTGDFSEEEARRCEDVNTVIRGEMSASGDKVAAWARAWREVYALADAVMDRVEATHGGA